MSLQSILEDELIKYGFDIAGNIDYFSNKFQRFKRLSRPRKGKNIFVKILGNLDGASFGDWSDASTWSTVWVKPYKELSPKERVVRKKIESDSDKLAIARSVRAVKRAGILISRPYCKEPDENQGYVKLKKIKAVYAGQIRSRLVIPIYNIEGQIQSLQFINKYGDRKRYMRWTSPQNGYLCLGEKIVLSDVIRICEGYATGCSIYEAIGAPVIVAFSADNLKNICRLIRSKYPNNKIIICADNDQWKEKNTGLEVAVFCAENYDALIRYPNFSGLDVNDCPTDFNDLMSLGGLTATEAQLI